jgi:hypothetical protein
MGNPQRSAFTGERQETVRVGMGLARHMACGARLIFSPAPAKAVLNRGRRGGNPSLESCLGAARFTARRSDLYTNEILVLPFRR